MKIREADKGMSFFRWSIANIAGFALGGVVASLAFPPIAVAAFFAGIPGFFCLGLLPAAVAGALVGLIISGCAGYMQREVLGRKAGGWTGRSSKSGLIGGALAGTVGIFQLPPFTPPPTSTGMGGGPGSFFPLNWLFHGSPLTVFLLALAGGVTGFCVGRQQRKGTEGSARWPLWSALGWGRVWGVTAVAAEPLSTAAGIETIVSTALNGNFEDWPAQLGAAALSMALCGFVYALVTFLPVTDSRPRTLPRGSWRR
jgi:hypothetical protein